MIKLILEDQFARRAFALGYLGRDVLQIAENGAQLGVVLLQEIGEGSNQIIDVIAAKALRQIFHAGGDVVELDHDRAQIHLLRCFDERILSGNRGCG